MTVVIQDEDAGRDFESLSLHSLDQFCETEAGTVVTTASTRVCRRIEVESRCYFVKTQDLSRTTLPVRKYPSYFFRGSPLEREEKALRTLATLGFRTPTVVAFGMTRFRGMPRRALLATRAVEGHLDLAAWSSTDAADDDEVASATFDAARELVQRAHAKGIVLLGAKYRNLLVPTAGCRSPDEIYVLDQPDLKASASKRLRTKDLELLTRDRIRYARGR